MAVDGGKIYWIRLIQLVQNTKYSEKMINEYAIKVIT